MGTWNVRTLYGVHRTEYVECTSYSVRRTLRRCGKFEELTNELKRYRWDIISLAELRMIT